MINIEKSPLYNLRSSYGLTAREAADRLGLSEKHLRKIEGGDCKLSLSLAKLLDSGVYESDKKFLGKSIMKKQNNWIQRKNERKEKSID
jgi:transcriptional regulator with XRE-family HTH domain